MRGPWFAAALLAGTAIIGAACSDRSEPAASPTPASPASVTPVAVAPSPLAPVATATPVPVRPGVPTPDIGPHLGTAAGINSTTKDPSFSALPGAKATFGTLGNAVYRIEMPA